MLLLFTAAPRLPFASFFCRWKLLLPPSITPYPTPHFRTPTLSAESSPPPPPLPEGSFSGCICVGVKRHSHVSRSRTLLVAPMASASGEWRVPYELTIPEVQGTFNFSVFSLPMFDAPVQAMMMLNKTMTRLLTQSPFASTLIASCRKRYIFIPSFCLY